MQGIDPRDLFEHALDRVPIPNEPLVVPGPTWSDPVMPEKTGNKKARLKLSKAQQWARKMQIASLHAEGVLLGKIAESMGLSTYAVTKELNALVDEFRKKALETVATQIAREDAFLYMLQLEAIEAWDKSKKGKLVETSKRATEIRKMVPKGEASFPQHKSKVRTLKTQAGAQIDEMVASAFDEDDDEEEETQKESPVQIIETHHDDSRMESSVGDPRFMQILLDISDRRCKLHALYPKQDFQGSSGLGQGQGEKEVQMLTSEEKLQKITDMFARARQEKARSLALNEATESVNSVPLVAQTAPKTAAQNAEDMWDATAND
jgi:hypothetical protein